MFGSEIDKLQLIVTTVSTWREVAESADVAFVGGRFRFGTTEVVLQWDDKENDWIVDTIANAVGRPVVEPAAAVR